MSRESSSQGPLSALAGSTPEGGVPPLLKGKSKGRFQVCVWREGCCALC